MNWNCTIEEPCGECVECSGPGEQSAMTYEAILAEELVKHPLREFEDADYSYAASQAYKRWSGVKV